MCRRVCVHLEKETKFATQVLRRHLCRKIKHFKFKPQQKTFGIIKKNKKWNFAMLE